MKQFVKDKITLLQCDCLELNKTIKNQSEIARQLNLSIATVNRYLKPSWIPFQTNARYFSDFIRDKTWFQKL